MICTYAYYMGGGGGGGDIIYPTERSVAKRDLALSLTESGCVSKPIDPRI